MSENEENKCTIDHHIAIKLLEVLLKGGQLESSKFDHFKAAFEKLDSVFMKVQSNEKAILNELKELKKVFIEKENKTKESNQIRDENRYVLGNMQNELSKAQQQAYVVSESNEELQTKIQELEKKKKELQEKLDRMREERLANEKPIIDAFNKEIDELYNSIEQCKAKLEKHKEEKNHYLKKIESEEAELDELDNKLSTLEAEYKEIEDNPNISQKQAMYMEKAKEAADKEFKSVIQECLELEKTVKAQKDRKLSITEKERKQIIAMDQAKLKTAKLERTAAVQRSTLIDSREIQKQVLEKKVELELEITAKTEMLNYELEQLRALENSKSALKKQIQGIQTLIESGKSDIERLEQAKQVMVEEKAVLEEQVAKNSKVIAELEKDMDILINTFLNSDSCNKELCKRFKIKQAEVRELEELVSRMEHEEWELMKQKIQLQAIRERKVQEGSEIKRKFIEAMGEVKIKGFLNHEYYKKVKELEAQNKLLTKNYALMKESRNKYAKELQSSAHKMIELREKNKILQNEIDILTRQAIALEKSLIKIHRELNEEFTQREASRIDASKLMRIYEQKSQRNLEQIMEIERLNIIITLTEDHMLSLKKQYEEGVEYRNYTGIQLLDRNDELCILYEKASVQDQILKSGELELRRSEEEIKMKQLELENATRELRIAAQQIPVLKALYRRKKELKKLYKEIKRQKKYLSKQLLDPKNEKRWRKLTESNPNETIMQLKAKIQTLEEKINKKQEQVLEKNLILMELTNNSDKLRKQAIAGRDATFDLSVNMNDIQARIREINRTIMATLSELSIYQANAIELQKQNKEKTELIILAKQKLEKGEAPSKEWEIKYEKDLQRQKRWKEMLRAKKEALFVQKLQPASVTRTTAPPRPVAYIPDDDLQLPQPYFMKPFMYSEPGTTFFKYARKPQPREVEV